ncbi:uncharacterized protein [Aphelocoma coerulescens]|uniref:uncharacterized protein n=1 Tax=Aphelocoma coerulescens TaxID=39617 RepID=UPI0036046BA8
MVIFTAIIFGAHRCDLHAVKCPAHCEPSRISLEVRCSFPSPPPRTRMSDGTEKMEKSSLQTDSVVTVWKGVFSIMHTSVPENSLCELLDWAALHGISPDRDTALDFGLWQELGCPIRHELPSGDPAVLELFRTWRLLFILLTDLDCGSRAGSPVSVASEGEISEGDPTNRAPEACGGGSKKTSPVPRAEPAPVPAPGHTAQSQGSAAPKDPVPAEAGVSGQREGAQPTLPLGSAAATAFSGTAVQRSHVLDLRGSSQPVCTCACHAKDAQMDAAGWCGAGHHCGKAEASNRPSNTASAFAARAAKHITVAIRTAQLAKAVVAAVQGPCRPHLRRPRRPRPL